jgi:translation initiation factor IF-1
MSPAKRLTGDIAYFQKEKGNQKMKEELIQVAGTIVDKQRDANFKVKVNGSEHIVMAQISGRMRRNRIRILIGDRVDVEMSPYDLTKGRITYRHK